ncbi:MAG: hypothetical protein U1F68_03255 [Gammaproteobacteria bacterium]
MQTVDTLLGARWTVPVEPENQVYENHALAIQMAGFWTWRRRPRRRALPSRQ